MFVQQAVFFLNFECFHFPSPESSFRPIGRGPKRNFRRIRRPFDVGAANFAENQERCALTAATAVRRAGHHVHRLRQTLSSAPHEGADLEEFPLDVAQRGRDAVHHRFTVPANHPVLLGDRTRSARPENCRLQSWAEPKRFRWLSGYRRLQLHVAQLSLSERIAAKGNCRGEWMPWQWT